MIHIIVLVVIKIIGLFAGKLKALRVASWFYKHTSIQGYLDCCIIISLYKGKSIRATTNVVRRVMRREVEKVKKTIPVLDVVKLDDSITERVATIYNAFVTSRR